MTKPKTYESFPLKTVFLTNLFALSIYMLGAYILTSLGLIPPVFYLFYCLTLETFIFKRSCIHCYYYGKNCGLGKGKTCTKFFKKGDPEKFDKKEVNLLKLLPDFMIFIIPIVTAIILLVRNFDWVLLCFLLAFVFLCFAGNAVVRGSFICKYCHQRLIHCPAEKFFKKKK